MTGCINPLLWHVIYTYPKAEKKIYSDLLRLNIESYLPLQKVVRQWSDRKKRIEVPLFPNYVFVKAEQCERWKVLSVDGVVKFISFNGILSTVSDFEINMIRKILQGEHVTIVQENYIGIGRRVRVARGRFAGLEGTLVEKKGKVRLLIRIDSISQSLSMDIPSDSIEEVREHTFV